MDMVSAVNEWSRWDEGGPANLPPDLTPPFRPGAHYCRAEHPHGVVCTRLLGHTGRHAAGDGDMIVAVWADRASEALTGAEFDAAVERAVRVLARDCQVCSEYPRMAEYGGCPDCYSLATRIVSDVLLPEGGATGERDRDSWADLHPPTGAYRPPRRRRRGLHFRRLG